jgi:predicted flap endonuclease-1-like 5' DNA nuclease
MSASLRFGRVRFLIVASVLAALFVGSSAMASHYSLAKVDFVTTKERKLLSRAGILDTQVLLEWLGDDKNRRWVSDQTGLDDERLRFLAARCDLLRIVGIGPTIAEALQKAEVLDTSDLARDNADDLLARLKVATRGSSMANKLPAEDTLDTWIRAAKRLRARIDFDPWEVPALVKIVRTGRERAQLVPDGQVLPPP